MHDKWSRWRRAFPLASGVLFALVMGACGSTETAPTTQSTQTTEITGKTE